MRTIIYVDNDGSESVKQLFDADIIGMPITVEYTLRCAWNTIKPGTFPDTYQLSMTDDPWLKWVLESQENYNELWNYGMDLLDEHMHRFGSRVTSPYHHGSKRQLDRLGALPDMTETKLTPMPIQVPEARELMREELKTVRPGFNWAQFSHRETPEWLK